MKQFTVLATFVAIWATASAAPSAEPEPFLGMHSKLDGGQPGTCQFDKVPGITARDVASGGGQDDGTTDATSITPQEQKGGVACTSWHKVSHELQCTDGLELIASQCKRNGDKCKVKVKKGSLAHTAHCSGLFGGNL
ncbi:hypothetical protein ANO11243_079810 [Dothideomycetidae sp. 11243]|nr:hypothetical protein ANO11243_079810 [fungal sp. No.11243]